MAPSKEGDDARNGSSSRPSPAHQATPPPARTPSRPSTPSQLSPPPARSPRPRSPLHNLAYRRRSSAGMRIANGIPIPSHMASPGAEGYRTPTIEDYEMHFRQAPQPGTTTRQPTPEPEADRAAAETSSSTDREKGSGAGMNGDAAGSLRARRPSIRFPHLAEGDEHRRSFLERHSNILSPLSLAALSDKLNDKLEWRQRLRHFTWNFFSLTMATGGIANVLHNVPYRFDGLYTIGLIFCLFNFVLYIACILLISFRFVYFSETFKASFLHPTESLFMPASVVSFATVLLNIGQYGVFHTGPWLQEAVIILFWIFVILAVLTSSGIYLLMWSTQTFTISSMTPVWIFPAYPLLVVGPLAVLLSGPSYIDETRTLDVMIAGFVCQGIGFLVSMTIYSAFIYRLMTQKLPQENVRPGMFVSVGPSGFTCVAVAGLASHAPAALSPDFMGDGKLAGSILHVVGSFASLWFWGLALWFFFVSVGAHWTCLGRGGSLQFGMTWFSFVFPNTALITATFAVGSAFGSSAINYVGCAATCVLIAVWFVVFIGMVHAIATKKVLWPQKGEDRDEGGFKGPPNRRPSKPSATAHVSAV